MYCIYVTSLEFGLYFVLISFCSVVLFGGGGMAQKQEAPMTHDHEHNRKLDFHISLDEYIHLFVSSKSGRGIFKHKYWCCALKIPFIRSVYGYIKYLLQI